MNNKLFIFVVLILLGSYIAKKQSQEEIFLGTAIQIDCVKFGKSDVGLEVTVQGDDETRTYVLPPKDALCIDLIKNAYLQPQQNVTITYTHV